MEIRGLGLQALVQPLCVESVPELACSSGVYASRGIQYSVRQLQIFRVGDEPTACHTSSALSVLSP